MHRIEKFDLLHGLCLETAEGRIALEQRPAIGVGRGPHRPVGIEQHGAPGLSIPAPNARELRDIAAACRAAEDTLRHRFGKCLVDDVAHHVSGYDRGR